MENSTSTSQERIAQSALRTTVGSVACLLAGVASQLVVAWAFGAGLETDAYLTATVIPSYLQAVLLGALSFVFVPSFVRELSADREADAWALVATLFLLVGGFLGLVAVAGTLLAPQIISSTAPGLTGYKAELAVRMFRVLVLVVPVSGLGSLATGVQNARGYYFWPATAPALGSLGNLAVVILGRGTLGPMALALGGAVSVVLQSSVVLIPCLNPVRGGLLPLGDQRLREFGRLLVPLVLFGVFTRVAPVSERFFASSLSNGDLSYLGYASKVSGMVLSLTGAGIAAGLFPEMTREFELRGKDGLAKSIDYGFRLTLATIIPVFSMLSVLGVPLVELLLERGTFSHIATVGVAHVLPLALLTVVFQMLGNVVGRAYYVVKDTVTNPAVGAVAAVFGIVFAMILVRTAGYTGLAVAQALQVTLAVLAGYALMPQYMRVLSITASVHYLLAGIATATTTWMLMQLLGGLGANSLSIVAAGLIAGTAVYLVVLRLWGETSVIITVLEPALSMWRSRIASKRQKERIVAGGK